MKLLSLSSAIIAASATLSLPSLAATTIFDNNGNSRITNYSQGPIASIYKDHTSAREVSLFVYRNSFQSVCSSANIYNSNTDSLITRGNIIAGDVNTSTLNIRASLPEAALDQQKVVRIQCTSENGTAYSVEHKIPAVPSVQWNSNLVATSEWTPAGGCQQSHCNPGFGSFASMNYNASLNVVNHSMEGSCQLDWNRGADIALFHGQNSRENFHTDYFTTNVAITEYEPPVIIQRISCQNSAGTTSAVQVWEIVGGTIEQVEDTTFVQ